MPALMHRERAKFVSGPRRGVELSDVHQNELWPEAFLGGC
jgi:hypothetical protein